MRKILYVSSEAHPLIKTGGLADVAGALPRALQGLGCDVRLMLPGYRTAIERAGRLRTIAQFVPPGATAPVTLLEGVLPGTRVKIWLVDHPPSFDRPGNPYLNAQGQPWPDNAARFALLARTACAVAEGHAGLAWQPDLIHCNDWQTGLIPALLSRAPSRPATLFTIHNLAYQGLFPQDTLAALGLAPEFWSHHALEFHGQLSFIKGGLVFADRINTVSPRYAREIQTAEFGYGLEGLLQFRQSVLSGIINGIDEKAWNPSTDPALPAHYSWRDTAGKAQVKHALQAEFGLPQHPRHLLLGFIGRMVEQKGVDLIVQVLPQLLKMPIQLAALGSGEKHFEDALRQLAAHHPQHIGLRIGYDEDLAHRIEAGADAFLMPSRFEPCGLNQLYSLRYGTVPIVHGVGGLADTVVDADPKHLDAHTATGVIIAQPTATALLEGIQRACNLYAEPEVWCELMVRGMQQKFTWHESAAAYVNLYDQALQAI